MCVQKNIENLNQFCRALKQRYPNGTISFEETTLLGAEIVANIDQVAANNYYYGILTSGDNTGVSFDVMGGCTFTLQANEQIIEPIEQFRAVTLDGNCFFRGYLITVTGI